jgi:hypothetical protein
MALYTEGAKTTLETSGKDVKLHSKRVEKMSNYTRNECELPLVTLVTLSSVSPLVEAMFAEMAKCTCFAYGQTGSGKTHTMMGPPQSLPSSNGGQPLPTTVKLHSERVEKMRTTLETSGKDANYTRNEWRRCELHSKRAEKMRTTLETSEEDANYTRNEWRRCGLHPKRVMQGK